MTYIKNDNGIFIPEDSEPDCYYAYNGCKYRKPESWGYTSLEVLPFLKGEPFDLRALDYIHSLRPSTIRVSKTGEICCDSHAWRVTVYLDEDRLIRKIQQEVNVGCRTADHGHGLEHRIPKGTER